MASTIELAPTVAEVPAPERHRVRRLFFAWVTLLPSKAITLVVQLVAVPIVYRAIGPEQFAAYAAVTASVSILGFLNLGMGGALVTPLAQAAADGDHPREASLVGATLLPIAAIAGLALCIALPLLWILPPKLLFGLAAVNILPQTFRIAAVFACIGTIAAAPLSVVDSARQSYQEVHISNLYGTLTNAILCVGLLLTAWFRPTLPMFVAMTALSPLAVRVLNAMFLFIRRPYLLRGLHSWGSWLLVRSLAREGFSYMGAAAFANMLVYQWPVYYIARVRPPLESSTFAVYVQLILLALSFGISLAQPLWPAVADASARGDRSWITGAIRGARLGSIVYGAAGLFAFGFGMSTLLRLWLHRAIVISPVLSWLAGAYFALAIWEYVHWPLTLGLGAMTAASNLVFARCILFAALVPVVAKYGLSATMALLCLSIASITAWRYPQLLSGALAVRFAE